MSHCQHVLENSQMCSVFRSSTSARWQCECNIPWYTCDVHASLGHTNSAVINDRRKTKPVGQDSVPPISQLIIPPVPKPRTATKFNMYDRGIRRTCTNFATSVGSSAKRKLDHPSSQACRSNDGAGNFSKRKFDCIGNVLVSMAILGLRIPFVQISLALRPSIVALALAALMKLRKHKRLRFPLLKGATSSTLLLLPALIIYLIPVI